MDYTLADMVGMVARSRPDQVAATVLGATSTAYTFAQLWDRVGDLADAVSATAGGEHGPMVATLLPNGLDALASYLACQRAGVGAVPLNNRLADRELQHILADSEARTVLAAGEYVEVARRIAAPGVRVVDADTVVPGERGRDLIEDPARGERVAVVFYTSGTTGLPKGAAVRNDDWIVNTMRWGWQLRIQWDERTLVPGPLFHMSYSSFALATWLMGGEVRIMPSFSAAEAYDEFAERATFAFLVPSMTQMIHDEWVVRGRAPMRTARSIMTSGAAAAADLVEAAFDMFPDATIQETYGWTEAGFATMEVKSRDTVRRGTVGYSTVGSDVAVFDDDGRPCPPGQRGEVGIRTIAASIGYLSPQAAGADTRRGPWILSGDIGSFDDAGRLTIVDRKHGMIISGGENVYAAEVEQVVDRHPAVHECVVVGRPSRQWGEEIVAVAVLEDGAELQRDDLRAYCREHLADYKVPRDLVVVAALPRNSMGKLQRFEVKRVLEAAG
ncbi:class I adenylate-forming enzyme family protein [Nocardioides sp. L-11A]|uniref:class I adenylate-forming enzyme family protein n=1 Tax=Nocardioides sp. L-11A TaxID=3043848 RepID=UPI00249C318C|nr:AMP-binding protein [Nocardioides sp. L-11A]